MSGYNPGLILSGLASRAGDFELGPIDLDVPRDRVLVILGPSGAGKTTLLQTIAAFRTATAGSVTLAGRELTRIPAERRSIGYVFQDAALFPHLSVRENIRFPLRARRDTRDVRVDELQTRFGITGLAGRSPRSLSGGERQRVALARALAAEPQLLLLDEPLSALDQPTREELRAELQDLLVELRIPAVHVTHDRDEALSLGDDIAIIVEGQLRQAGRAGEVVTNPSEATVARMLGWAELGRGTLDGQRLTIGDFVLYTPDTPAARGVVDVFYRPEDVLLGPALEDSGAAGKSTAPIARIAPTVPLARVILASTPVLTALVLTRDLERLGLRAGATTKVQFPTNSIRIFPTTDGACPSDPAYTSR